MIVTVIVIVTVTVIAIVTVIVTVTVIVNVIVIVIVNVKVKVNVIVVVLLVDRIAPLLIRLRTFWWAFKRMSSSAKNWRRKRPNAMPNWQRSIASLW